MYRSAIKRPLKSDRDLVQLHVVTDSDAVPAPTLGRRSIIVGALVLLGFLVALGVWATTAQLTSAAIALGVVGVEGERKTVQHFEGGIIKEIRTKEAARVTKGDVLVVLDATEAETNSRILEQHLLLAEARAARLRSERDNLATIKFPEHLVTKTDDQTAHAAMTDQKEQFEKRRQRYDRLLDGYEERLKQLNEQVLARNKGRENRARQLELIKEELEKLSLLEQKGLLSSDRIYSIQRNETEVLGQQSSDLATIAGIHEEIAGVQMQILELEDRRSNAADQELQDLNGDLVEARQRLRAANETLRRTLVIAPSDGTVMNMAFHTPGGVIKPGEPILDIVPGSPKLVIDAKLEPKDRDVVRAGLPAEIRFSAFSRRSSTPVPGKVIFVSADHVPGDGTANSEAYYLARVELVSPESSDVPMPDIHPGMQAEVMIVTGKRTVIEYITRPLRRSIARAGKED